MPLLSVLYHPVGVPNFSNGIQFCNTLSPSSLTGCALLAQSTIKPIFFGGKNERIKFSKKGNSTFCFKLEPQPKLDIKSLWLILNPPLQKQDRGPNKAAGGGNKRPSNIPQHFMLVFIYHTIGADNNACMFSAIDHVSWEAR